MSQIEIRPVSGKSDLKAFVALPGQVSANDPHWVEPLHIERGEFYSPKKNPWYANGRAALFLAWKDGRPVGRISAQIDGLLPSVEGQTCGLFGSLSAYDDAAAVHALLDAAEAWLRAEGAGRMRGPLTFNMNHEVGLLIDGFDTDPFILMHHDPAHLQAHVESWGLEKARDVYAYRLNTDNGLPEKLRRFFKKAPDNLVIRDMNVKEWDQDVAHIARIFHASWKDNWGFNPYSDAEIKKLEKDMRPIVDGGLCRIAEVDGEPIGFITLLPNVNEAIKDFKGKLFPFNIIKLLWRLKFQKIRGARVPLMGVMPNLDPAVSSIVPLMLIYSPEKRYRERGFRELEFGWILEDNRPVRRLIEMLGSHIEKTYRVYERPLD
ncbi:MAG: dATP pyrophosphohydrolase [Pseudomonadota bacterium]